MRTRNILTIATALLVAAAGLASPATALLTSDLHDYEGLGHLTAISTQYTGFTYGGATTLCAPNYNYLDYPPSSGDCVVYSPTGTITVDVDLPGLSTYFGADFNRGSGPLTIELSLFGLATVETIDCGHATFGGPPTTCESTTGLPFNMITISGTGNFYTVDDLTVSR